MYFLRLTRCLFQCKCCGWLADEGTSRSTRGRNIFLGKTFIVVINFWLLKHYVHCLYISTWFYLSLIDFVQNPSKGIAGRERWKGKTSARDEQWDSAAQRREVRDPFFLFLLEWQIQEFRISIEKCWKLRKGTIESSAEEVSFEQSHHRFVSD